MTCTCALVDTRLYTSEYLRRREQAWEAQLALPCQSPLQRCEDRNKHNYLPGLAHHHDFLELLYWAKDCYTLSMSCRSWHQNLTPACQSWPIGGQTCTCSSSSTLKCRILAALPHSVGMLASSKIPAFHVPQFSSDPDV